MTADFHSHILPGIDDGSASADESAQLLRLEAAQGIDTVVLTPHFYPDRDNPRHFLEKRDAALRRIPSGIPNLPELHLGAEVYYFRNISDCDALSELAITGSRCIMVEMPPPPWPESCYRELEQIYLKQSLTPVIAHIDRYISPLRTFSIPQRLSQLPVVIQANADFFLHRRTASMAMKMLQSGQIHLLGSDCHNLKDRQPNLGPALDRIRAKLGESVLLRLQSNAQFLLSRKDM